MLLDVSLMLAYLPQKGVTPKGVEDVEEFNFEVSAGGREVCMCACACVCVTWQRRGLELFLAA